MYESAFDNLSSNYMNNYDNDSIFSKYGNQGKLEEPSDSVLNKYGNQGKLEEPSDSVLNKYGNQGKLEEPSDSMFISNSHSETMFGSNQNSINSGKSKYLQNGQLDSNDDPMGVIDRSRSLNDVMNTDQSQMKSLQSRFTNTNTIEDMSALGDNQSNLTLQGRRTNTNSVEDNSIYNNESIMLAEDYHKMLIDDKKSREKPVTNNNSSYDTLAQIKEEQERQESGIKSDDEMRASSIQHATTEIGGNAVKPNKQNVSSMDEEENENSKLKSKKNIKKRRD